MILDPLLTLLHLGCNDGGISQILVRLKLGTSLTSRLTPDITAEKQKEQNEARGEMTARDGFIRITMDRCYLIPFSVDPGLLSGNAGGRPDWIKDLSERNLRGCRLGRRTFAFEDDTRRVADLYSIIARYDRAVMHTVWLMAYLSQLDSIWFASVVVLVLPLPIDDPVELQFDHLPI